jgi:hypothetical protein
MPKPYSTGLREAILMDRNCITDKFLLINQLSKV